MEINPCGPYHLRLLFHQRQKNDNEIMTGHPTIEAAIEKIRKSK